MMDIGSTELLMIVIVAIVVIGPKDLPRALYKVGQVIGKAKGMARHFRSGIDAMVREVELEEMEKKWKADNERIMREYAAANPAAAPVPAPAAEPAPAMEPLAEPPAAIAAPAAPVTEGER
ncbi:MAG: translocase [Blastomonas sp. CACIA14H2]|uniref:Sec-independent protein translocase protein TatB n=1 Tax=Blastomonas sp. CACIA14H2 TaxID=1419876 RepID=UPI0003CFD0FF|nr:MAG: translocase [Blastomonas sp. CACIA14H2]